MPVKEVPVPTGEELQEAQEPQEVQPEDVLIEELPELKPESKPVKKKRVGQKQYPREKQKLKRKRKKWT